MGIGIGSVVSLGLSVLPKIAAPIASVAKSVGLDNVSSFVTAGASALSGGQGGGDSKDAMKKSNEAFIMASMKKMLDDAQAEQKKAADKTTTPAG